MKAGSLKGFVIAAALLASLFVPHAARAAQMDRAQESAGSRDAGAAINLLKSAAARGEVQAQVNLALKYQYGEGVPQDYAKAKEWNEKAAAQGNRLATSNLGVLYEHGWGTKQDYAKAMKLYRRAAAMGLPMACNNIGYMYDKGLGVKRDYVEAYVWYSRSINSRSDEARKVSLDLLEIMKSKMSPREIAEGKKRAASEN